LATLSEKHAALQKKIQKERKTVQIARTALAEGNAKVAVVQAVIDSIFSRKFFKLTAPLRRLMSLS
jgi:hypothetical protein